MQVDFDKLQRAQQRAGIQAVVLSVGAVCFALGGIFWCIVSGFAVHEARAGVALTLVFLGFFTVGSLAIAGVLGALARRVRRSAELLTEVARAARGGSPVSAEALLATVPAERAALGREILERIDCEGILVSSPPVDGEAAAERYTVLREIGVGGAATVSEVLDGQTGIHRALKVLHSPSLRSARALERFEREVAVVRLIDHPAIPRIHDVGTWQDGRPFAVMDLIDGQSLRQIITERGPLPWADVMAVTWAVGGALSAAHRRGVVHRDVKPENILVSRGAHRRVFLTDFGLAAADDEAKLTLAGKPVGTPAYMAPEQARGEAVDRRADVFALGAVVFETATGTAAITAGSLFFESAVPDRAGALKLPTGLVQICGRAMAEKPHGRFGSVDELLGALASLEPAV